MKTREEAAAYGLTFPDSYEDRPFKDQRWQVIRVKPGKKIFFVDLRKRRIDPFECKDGFEMERFLACSVSIGNSWISSE